MSIQKLGTCGVCGKNDAKYRCPKCETVSCSLACSKAHKKLKNSCDGIRDKTKFVPIKNFSSMELVSDLSLLENAARYSVEKSKSEKPIKFEKKKSFQHPQAFQALQRACYRRNRCRLLGLPYHFSRHRENTSTYDTPNDTILWKISWMVPHHVTNIMVSDRVSERSRLGDLVKEVLKRIEGDLNEDEISVYKTTQLKDFDVLLKCEFMQTYSKENLRYIELDTEKSLVWNLQELELVENPTIAIVHKHHSGFFVEDNEEKIVDVSQTTDSNINDEPSIFLGLNFDADSADDQNQPDQQPKKVQKIKGDTSIQNSASLPNHPSTAAAAAATKPKTLESNNKSGKSASSLSSLVCYASSEDDEN